MRVLYGIFVLSVGALVWAAVAAARHIRRHESEAAVLRENHSRADLPAHEEVVPTTGAGPDKR